MSRVPGSKFAPPVMIATFPESLEDMVPCVGSRFVRLPECNDVTNKERSKPCGIVFADCLLTFPSSINIPRWLPCVHAGCCTLKLSKLSGIPRASGWAGDVGGSYAVRLAMRVCQSREVTNELLTTVSVIWYAQVAT